MIKQRSNTVLFFFMTLLFLVFRGSRRRTMTEPTSRLVSPIASNPPWVSSNYRGLGDPYASLNELTVTRFAYTFKN